VREVHHGLLARVAPDGGWYDPKPPLVNAVR
jgi:hypothetical protein